MEPLIFLFIFFGVGAGITCYNYSHHRGLLLGVMPCLEDPQILGFMTPRLAGKYKGYSLSITITPGGKNSPPGIALCLYTATPFQLHMYREGTLQRVGKKLGLVDEIEIGVADFDDNYIIQTASASRAQAYLSSRSIRNGIDFFFNSGYHDFQVVDGALLVEKRSDNITGDLDSRAMTTVLGKLVHLARNL